VKAIWLNDIHLNFLAGEQVYAFLDKLRAEEPDAVLVGATLARPTDFALYLQEMAGSWAGRSISSWQPDFYRGHRRRPLQGRNRLPANAESPRAEPNGRRGLTKQVGLVGHDGWGDGRCGDYVNSRGPVERLR